MLTDCLRSWTEDLTIEGENFEHDLEEPNLMHSNDFDDSEEVLCADAVEVWTFLFREDELEDDFDEWHRDQWLDSLDVFNNEEAHMNDDFASDEGDMLDT